MRFSSTVPAMSLFFVLACTWETKLPDDVTSIPIDRDKELLIADEAVLDPLASNTNTGPLSFRYATEHLRLGEGATLGWLEVWGQHLRAEGEPQRARILEERVTCPWLHADPSNQCDASCGSCSARRLDLGRAPFRLVAVVNRTDLAVLPDRTGEGGEGRLVFALTEGPADDARSVALPFAVIYEYAQRGSALDWAKRWHTLGEATSKENLEGRLAVVTSDFVATGTLAQIRTADRLTGPMVLHQFTITDDAIVIDKVRNTPDWSRLSEDQIRTFEEANTKAIENGTALMPREWWAHSSSPSNMPPSFVSDQLRRQTCGGCHARSDSTFLHVDPTKKGAAKLSEFLSNDELPRRTEALRLVLSRRVSL